MPATANIAHLRAKSEGFRNPCFHFIRCLVDMLVTEILECFDCSKIGRCLSQVVCAVWLPQMLVMYFWWCSSMGVCTCNISSMPNM